MEKLLEKLLASTKRGISDRGESGERLSETSGAASGVLAQPNV
jgi:hypothetical protein